MSKKKENAIIIRTSVDMTADEVEVFNSLKNIRGLGAMITRILIAYAHEKGMNKVSIPVLDGYARVSEAERSKNGDD